MKNLNKAVTIQSFFDEAPLEVAELVLGLAEAAVKARRQADAPERPATGKRRGRPPGSKNRATVPPPTEESPS